MRCKIISNRGDILDAINDILHIPSISNETGFWMIRTKRGFFFNEFISQEYIAIGWNLITQHKLKNTLEGDLKAQIKEVYHEKVPGSALNKCIRFCSGMKPGDIVVIADTSQTAFAIVGDYYEQPDPQLTPAYEKEFTAAVEREGKYPGSMVCPYVKRRHIVPIKVLQADEFVSPYLKAAMSNNLHSLSQLNNYDELILSTCYDVYTYQDDLYVTFHVTQKDGIGAMDLSSLVLNAAALLSGGRAELVKIKTSLHSPGDIILQITDFLRGNSLLLLLCFIVIFGGRVKDYEFNSLLGFAKKALDAGYEKQKRSIELRKLEAEAKAAEQEAIAKELENLKFRHELAAQLVEDCVEPLAISADKLRLQPSDATLENMKSALDRLRID